MSGLGWLFNVPVLSFLGKGLLLTVVIALLSSAIAFVAGTLLAAARMSDTAVLRLPAAAYVETLRSLPLLLVVFFVFFALNPMLGLNFSPFWAGVVALSSFNAAIVAEIVRAGMQSVDRGILEAARSQAFDYRQILLKIQIPLALRRMTPALVTQFISLAKSTSLLVVIGVEEFLSRAVIVTANPPYDPVPVYLLVAITYFALNYSLSLIGGRLERSESGGIRHL